MSEEGTGAGKQGGRAKWRFEGPNRILVALVIVFGFVALYTFLKREGDQARDPGRARKAASAETIAKETRLDDLGQTIAIGPSALAVSEKGTQILGVEKVEGLAALLDGQDAEAVVKALVAAQVRHVLVDPSIAVRSPLPPDTVRNRLALGRPAGKLSAFRMTEAIFAYDVGEERPDLSAATAKAAIAVAREVMAGGAGEPPGAARGALERKGRAKVILTIRPLQARHLSFHSSKGESLLEAMRKVGEKARTYYESKKLEDQWGPLAEALKNKLTLEVEVVYDEGRLHGKRDEDLVWRFIEPGIYGASLTVDDKTTIMPPWYPVTGDYANVRSILDKLSVMAGEAKGYWRDSSVTLGRFRTVHYRELAPGGEVQEMYRASGPMPTMKDVTRENLVRTLKGLADWIADNQVNADGHYLYRYFPTTDEESDEYNMVRHALGPFSMALTQELAPDPRYKEKAEAGMRFIEDHIRWGGPPRAEDGSIDSSATDWMGKPLPGPDVAILDFEEPPKDGWSAKMGGVAVSILAYSQYKRVGWPLSPEREKVLEGLANFLLYMQKANGDFQHYYVAKGSKYYDTRNSIYPGEILYAVARLYGETHDERYRTAFKQSMAENLKWFKEEMRKKEPDGTYEEKRRKELVQFQPWIGMAMDEMYRYDPDPSYVEASNLVSLWIVDTFEFDETRAFYPDYLGGYMKVLDELPAMHAFVYTEGTSASFDLARRANADPAITAKLAKAALLTARFIMQQQATPGRNDYYYPNPKKAKGGVRYCLNQNKQRIDYTYHALSSLYRILKGATDEDFAAAQAIEMPREW
jgi:hypothetical protein